MKWNEITKREEELRKRRPFVAWHMKIAEPSPSYSWLR